MQSPLEFSFYYTLYKIKGVLSDCSESRHCRLWWDHLWQNVSKSLCLVICFLKKQKLHTWLDRVLRYVKIFHKLLILTHAHTYNMYIQFLLKDWPCNSYTGNKPECDIAIWLYAWNVFFAINFIPVNNTLYQEVMNKTHYEVKPNEYINYLQMNLLRDFVFYTDV